MSTDAWKNLQTIEADGPAEIVTIRLNRPEVSNAINSTMEMEINRILKACDDDDRVKCVVIAANGRHFSSGHDIAQVATERVTECEPATIDGKWWARTGELLPAWWFRKALVIAVKGFVGPHANALLLTADTVIAAENTIFSWEETRIGIGAPYGPYALMAFQFPMRVVKHLWMSGGWMDAETALRHSYVNRVVPLGDEEAVARRFAENIATMELDNLIANKQGIHKMYEAAGLFSMVEVGREPHVPKGAAYDMQQEHFQMVYEKGAGAAARGRDIAIDREISKV